MRRRPPRSTRVRSSAASDVYKRQGSPRGAGHALDVEVLDPDHVETGGEVGAGFLNTVFAPVAVPGFQPADQGLHSPAAVRQAPARERTARGETPQEREDPDGRVKR